MPLEGSGSRTDSPECSGKGAGSPSNTDDIVNDSLDDKQTVASIPQR